MLLVFMAVLAACLGVMLPLRNGLWAFCVGIALLFVVQLAINTATGFAGASLEESLLLFNGSILSYVGFNLQITYRAFALPLLVVSLVFIFRLTRR